MKKSTVYAWIVVALSAAFLGLVVLTSEAAEEKPASTPAAASVPAPAPAAEKPAEKAAEKTTEKPAESPSTSPAAPAAADNDLPVLPDIVMTLALAERTLGNPNAPIHVTEYASMTCSHCAHFHNSVFADVKQEFIDTGKVYWTMRDYPLDNIALKAAMMARCAPKENYFNLVEVIFSNQQRWIASDDQLDALKKLGKLAGLSEPAFDACMKNRELEVELLKRMQQGQTSWGIKATPTFVFNDGEAQFSGGQTVDEFRRTVEKILKPKGK